MTALAQSFFFFFLTPDYNGLLKILVHYSPLLVQNGLVFFPLFIQLESIQHQLDQRCQVLDELTAREGEQLEQVEMVKGMIHSLNSGLHTKQGEVSIHP